MPGGGGRSTNDGLGASGENMARLYQRKHYYFVPYGQDDPTHKPNSLKAGLCPSARCTGRCAGRAAAAAGASGKSRRVNVFSAGAKCGILLSDALPVQYDGQKKRSMEKNQMKKLTAALCVVLLMICVFVPGAAAAGPALVPPALTASSMQTPALCWHSRI